MRPNEFEFGIEREYALYAYKHGKVGYLLAVQDLLEILWFQISEVPYKSHLWDHMFKSGWRVTPEYSHCLLEVISPPYIKETWSELLEGISHIESWLNEAAHVLQVKLGYSKVICTSKYSVLTDLFISVDGYPITNFSELLVNTDDINYLRGLPSEVPNCFSGANFELVYAGFTSTHITLHLPEPFLPVEDSDRAEILADYFWYLLRLGREVQRMYPQSHSFLRNGQYPVPPHPDISVRDALIRWGDPISSAVLASVRQSLIWDRLEALQNFIQMFKQRPSASFELKHFNAYTCRPRIIDHIMLFELRCFHSGIPLVGLKQLIQLASAFSIHRKNR